MPWHEVGWDAGLGVLGCRKSLLAAPNHRKEPIQTAAEVVSSSMAALQGLMQCLELSEGCSIAAWLLIAAVSSFLLPHPSLHAVLEG